MREGVQQNRKIRRVKAREDKKEAERRAEEEKQRADGRTEEQIRNEKKMKRKAKRHFYVIILVCNINGQVMFLIQGLASFTGSMQIRILSLNIRGKQTMSQLHCRVLLKKCWVTTMRKKLVLIS